MLFTEGLSNPSDLDVAKALQSGLESHSFLPYADVTTLYVCALQGAVIFDAPALDSVSSDQQFTVGYLRVATCLLSKSRYCSS